MTTFTHAESGSTITVASDGKVTLSQRGGLDLKVELSGAVLPVKRVKAPVDTAGMASRFASKVAAAQEKAAQDKGDDDQAAWYGLADSILDHLEGSEAGVSAEDLSGDGELDVTELLDAMVGTGLIRKDDDGLYWAC